MKNEPDFVATGNLTIGTHSASTVEVSIVTYLFDSVATPGVQLAPLRMVPSIQAPKAYRMDGCTLGGL